MVTGPEWRAVFEGLVFELGVAEVARRVPAGRATIYRILNRRDVSPTLAIRAGVERVFRELKNKDEGHGSS